jgi:UDP-N-acetylmuramate--alanine ligase
MGTGDFMVVEADESDRSFLMLSPTLAIVTNIDEDHMESYAGLDDLKDAFVRFVNKVPFWCGDPLLWTSRTCNLSSRASSVAS